MTVTATALLFGIFLMDKNIKVFKYRVKSLSKQQKHLKSSMVLILTALKKHPRLLLFVIKKVRGIWLQDMNRDFYPLLERWLTGEQVGNHCYGRLCYDFTKIIIKENIDALDTRVFHVFFDHKTALLKSVQYLMMSNKITYDNILLDKLKNLQELALLSRNILLKYRIEHTTPELYSKKLLMYVEQIDKLDQEVFFALYKSIRSTLSHI